MKAIYLSCIILALLLVSIGFTLHDVVAQSKPKVVTLYCDWKVQDRVLTCHQ